MVTVLLAWALEVTTVRNLSRAAPKKELLLKQLVELQKKPWPFRPSLRGHLDCF
jgi:hypothetical protein